MKNSKNSFFLDVDAMFAGLGAPSQPAQPAGNITAPPLTAQPGINIMAPSQLFSQSVFAPAGGGPCMSGAFPSPDGWLIGNPTHTPCQNQAQTTERKGNKKLHLLFDILVYIFALALVIGSAMFAFSSDTGKSIFGYRFYHVLTQSMTPTFDPGDMIFIKICKPEEVKTGDIITFVPNQKVNAYLTHRVVDIVPAADGEPMRFVTRGDHNNADDPSIDSRVLVGKYVFHIPKAGAVINLIRQNLVIMGICIVAIFALVIVLRSYFSTKKAARSSGYIS